MKCPRTFQCPLETKLKRHCLQTSAKASIHTIYNSSPNIAKALWPDMLWSGSMKRLTCIDKRLDDNSEHSPCGNTNVRANVKYLLWVEPSHQLPVIAAVYYKANPWYHCYDKLRIQLLLPKANSPISVIVIYCLTTRYLRQCNSFLILHHCTTNLEYMSTFMYMPWYYFTTCNTCQQTLELANLSTAWDSVSVKKEVPKVVPNQYLWDATTLKLLFVVFLHYSYDNVDYKHVCTSHTHLAICTQL